MRKFAEGYAGSKMKAKVHVYLKPSVLDPQGKTILQALHRLGYDMVKDVRLGKEFYIDIDEDDPERARDLLEEMAKKLLANIVIEDFMIEVEE